VLADQGHLDLATAPYRQWVLSLPRQVRFLLARDRVLFGRVISAFLRKVFAWQRRRARVHGIADPHTGAVTFVQRFGSLLDLNCHAHALVPDGVFATGPDGVVSFHALPAPRDDDVVRLLGQIARAIHRLVERRLADLADDAPADLLAFEQADAVDHVPALGNPMGPTRGRSRRPRAFVSLRRTLAYREFAAFAMHTVPTGADVIRFMNDRGASSSSVAEIA